MTGFKKLIDKIKSLEERVEALEQSMVPEEGPEVEWDLSTPKVLGVTGSDVALNEVINSLRRGQPRAVGVDIGVGDDKMVVSVLEINDLGVPQLRDYCSGWNTLSEDPDQLTVVTIKEGE